MGVTRPGVPVELAARLRDRLRLVGAVETGTFLGDSAAVLATHFPQVWTIELAEPLWREAKVRHSRLTGITFLQGSSEDILPQVAAQAPGPLLYWLDGHYSAGNTAGKDNECPVLAEIRAVDSGPHGRDSVILIDDARLFQAPPGPPHDRTQWPSLMDVVDTLRAIHARYVTILEDVVIAVPTQARGVVEDYGVENQWTPESPGNGESTVVRLRHMIQARTASLKVRRRGQS